MGVIVKKVENGFILHREAMWFENPKKYIAKDYGEVLSILKKILEKENEEMVK